MNRAGVFLGGTAAGFVAAAVLAVGAGLVVVNLLLPWDDICATIGPLQAVVSGGREFIVVLLGWLGQAEELLLATTDAPSDLGGVLGGIFDSAGEIAGDALSTGLDFLTAPLQALIAVAEATLTAVENAVEAAENALASIDESRCN